MGSDVREWRKVSGFRQRALPGLVVCVCNAADAFSPVLQRRVSAELARAGIATRFVQLLSSDEQATESHDGLCWNVRSLGSRVSSAIATIADANQDVQIGIFCTGSCSAPSLAAARSPRVRAVVAFGGRPDLAIFALPAVQAATLLVVRGIDEASRHFAEIAGSHLQDKHEVHVLPRLRGRFQESGEQDLVCALATSWFVEAFSSDADDDQVRAER